MNDDRERTALEVFRGACELRRDERAAFLAATCGADRDLRAKVESMLAWDDTEDEAAVEGGIPHPVRVVLEDLAEEAEAGQRSAEPMPETVGSYRIVRLIAHGGMGVVYEAQQENPARRVAIKVARTSGTTSERAKRFELEAQLLARLRHPGIAQIIEAGTTRPEAGAQPFFAMEFVEGRTLTDYADEHLHSAREKLELMAKVCAAVAFAHAQGVTHRDLKPDNVLIEEGGAPKVLDFGVAKVQEAGGFGAATLRTVAGRVLGTMGYMAPEQLAGLSEEVGPPADVYSLGVMLYELLTGRLPHDLEAATITRALAIVTTTDAPLLSVVRPEYRGDIEALVAKALEKDPRHRYPDAAALQQDLERHLRGEPILARPAGLLRRATKWGRRNPALATAVFGLFFALSSAAGVLAVMNQEVGSALAEFELLADSKRLEHAVQQADVLPPACEEQVAPIAGWLDEYRPLTDPERLRDREAALASIRGHAVGADGSRWRFDDDLVQLKHDVLAELVDGLADFAAGDGLYQQVGARLEMAGRIRESTVTARQADWDAAIARIRTNYDGLNLEPQVGLVPMGRDPDSGLEEFLHFETHVGDIPPAGRGARDTLGFDENSPSPQTGLVFVLIPGGTFLMGAQNDDENGLNYDPDALSFEKMVLREVTVEPFFLSKYEMTQGQWQRLTGENPSPFRGPTKPVTRVSWTACDQVLRRLGLVLPLEEQWEYAARAGAATNHPKWWTGPTEETLQGMENVFDETTANRHPEWTRVAEVRPAPFTDAKKQARFDAEEFGPPPVGSYEANGFGLYDIAGNVTEWCADQADPQRDLRACRGGNSRRSTFWARSTARIAQPVATEFEELGLRPAMVIRKRPQ